MSSEKLKKIKRKKRHERVRLRIKGSGGRPRLSVFCSHRNIFAQIIDDIQSKTLLSLSTQDKEIKQKVAFAGNIKAAEFLGETLAKKAKENGLTKVSFDKGAHSYHGKVKAFAESARKGGLEF
jgi:large subunit ribosomal protein L18